MSARKEGLCQMTSSLMWEFRNESHRDKEFVWFALGNRTIPLTVTELPITFLFLNIALYNVIHDTGSQHLFFGNRLRYYGDMTRGPTTVPLTHGVCTTYWSHQVEKKERLEDGKL